jgi:exopolysaccharide biosynthesis polyprenyl glycosylphosphotransferase
MPRALLQLLPFEMAVLGLFELAFLFALTFMLLTADGSALLLGPARLPRDSLELAAMLALTIAGTAATIGLYRPEVCLDRKRFLTCGILSAILAFPAILLVSGAWRMTLNSHHIAWLGGLLAIWLPFVLLVRLAYSALFPRMPATRRVMVVGSGARAARLRQRLSSRPRPLFEPVSPPDGSTHEDRRVWGIVVAYDDPALGSRETLFDSKLRGVPVYSDLTFQERHLGRIELETIDAHWLLFADGFSNGVLFRAFKRAFDVSVVLALTIATLPLMLMTALLIKLESPGPVLYRQERTGLHGKSFTVFKFRSMAVDAEVAGKPQWAQQRDPRVTRVGAFIRASRIDELPQLFNVLRGEMSMIGPRPERPVFVDELSKVIPFYNHRAYVKPGLTGWAQVNYPYGASVEDAREKLAYDLYYVKNRGVLLDLVILLSTVRVVLFREGAR